MTAKELVDVVSKGDDKDMEILFNEVGTDVRYVEGQWQSATIDTDDEGLCVVFKYVPNKD